MGMERRRVHRKRLAGISYFQFEAGSGGIVLDASEKGLAFQSADAIQQLGPSRFCISPRPEQRIQVQGDVIWTDRSRKTGGLRFVDQRPETMTQIREWLKQSGGSGTSEPDAEFPWPRWAVDGAQEGPSEGHRPGSPTSSSPPAETRARTEAREHGTAGPRPLHAWPPHFTPDCPEQSQGSPPSSGRLLRNIATGFLIGVFVLMPVVLFEDFHLFEKLRPKIADLLIHLGERLNGNADLPPPSAAPSVSPAPVPAEATPGRESTLGAPKPETPDDTHREPDASGSNDVPTSEPETPSKQTAEVSSKRRKMHFARDRSERVMQLWAAVGVGDSSAEVNLARLYMKGEGVPRNCEQARILLGAAAKGGNREARQQLLKLRTRGCW